ncbi:NTP pyrophosphatase (non-canonical NTP hydrolase) [Knoellia remsis]|uniref:NTP pyrophosphatase (Non-canonical NTP hydrolase) n=1 Tax=Knoellia remsis TaxID=407159 RepID=A0A2T0U2U7_9MICO|nr:nucleotide pyrophosphohydrolase [Knoellia remsis]PRY52233.1 NTP pyrophosphatase (non-canonical NTP hydrolase) [Knoellia remsis]
MVKVSRVVKDAGMPTEPYAVADLQADLRAFRDARDWGKFHDPKSLVLALVGEVGELAELFQWVPADEARAEFSSGQRQVRAGEEMADVFIYLLNLADVLDIDLLDAARQKLAAAAERFPESRHQGVAPHKS